MVFQEWPAKRREPPVVRLSFPVLGPRLLVPDDVFNILRSTQYIICAEFDFLNSFIVSVLCNFQCIVCKCIKCEGVYFYVLPLSVVFSMGVVFVWVDLVVCLRSIHPVPPNNLYTFTLYKFWHNDYKQNIFKIPSIQATLLKQVNLWHR